MRWIRLSTAMLASALMLGAVFPASGRADLILSYNIGFTGSDTPTSGEFTYDDTTEQFTSLAVVWDGIDFDLTSAANDWTPTPYLMGTSCGGEYPGGAQYIFEVLTQSVQGLCTNYDLQYVWGAQSAFDSFYGYYITFFTFEDEDIQGLDALTVQLDLPSATPLQGSGDWNADYVAPEPSSLLLLATGLVALALVGKRGLV